MYPGSLEARQEADRDGVIGKGRSLSLEVFTQSITPKVLAGIHPFIGNEQKRDMVVDSYE